MTNNQEKNSATEINLHSLLNPLQWMAVGSGSTIILLLSGFGAWTLASQVLIEGKTTRQNQLSLASPSSATSSPKLKSRLELPLPNSLKQQISSDVPLLPVFDATEDKEVLIAANDFQGNVTVASRTPKEVSKPNINRDGVTDKHTTKNLVPQDNERRQETSSSSSGNNSSTTTLASDNTSVDNASPKSSSDNALTDNASPKSSSDNPSSDNISFDWGWDFSEGLAKVQVGEKWGYVDRSGRMIIKPQFQEVSYFAENLASIKLDDKWGYIDRTGKIVIAPKFQEAKEFSEGFASVKFDGKWGYIDNKGDFTVQPQYETAESFREGLASIKTGDLWGYIDPVGSVKIAPQFTHTWGFSQGVAQVKVGNRIAYINKDGRFISQKP